jgi:hypothetical protein
LEVTSVIRIPIRSEGASQGPNQSDKVGSALFSGRADNMKAFGRNVPQKKAA